MTIHGANFYDGRCLPHRRLRDRGQHRFHELQLNQITTTIPPSIDPGTVNITVTTPAGTSAVSAADLYTYTGSGASGAPAITSAGSTTFSSGAVPGVFDVTTTGSACGQLNE